jgi:hypothetical protein
MRALVLSCALLMALWEMADTEGGAVCILYKLAKEVKP